MGQSEFKNMAFTSFPMLVCSFCNDRSILAMHNHCLLLDASLALKFISIQVPSPVSNSDILGLSHCLYYGHFQASSLLFFSQEIGAHRAQTFLSLTAQSRSCGLSPIISQHYEQYISMKSGVLFDQACNSSNIIIGNSSFGLPRKRTIFYVSGTILKFLWPSENYLYGLCRYSMYLTQFIVMSVNLKCLD